MIFTSQDPDWPSESLTCLRIHTQLKKKKRVIWTRQKGSRTHLPCLAWHHLAPVNKMLLLKTFLPVPGSIFFWKVHDHRTDSIHDILTWSLLGGATPLCLLPRCIAIFCYTASPLGWSLSDGIACCLSRLLAFHWNSVTLFTSHRTSFPKLKEWFWCGLNYTCFLQVPWRK